MKAGKTRTRRRAQAKDLIAAVHALEEAAHNYVGWDLCISSARRVESLRSARVRLVQAALLLAQMIDGEELGAVVKAIRAAS